MKTRIKLPMVILLGILILGCNQNTQNQESEEIKKDIINEEFPEAQTEIKEVLDGIFQSIKDKDPDKLHSYHAYGPKFSDFSGGMPRKGSEENAERERKLVSSITSYDYHLNDLKIAVCGEVAIVSYHGDFNMVFGEETKQVKTTSTLVFVKTKNSWKIIHEHSSPLIDTE
jgi:ketosteroid isomerase-like protein